eukprot:TRINITY_DN22448_c0_g1_i1.p2 TRINITY_DN22448_c0_g1~~TRINITY_DN22448_c0_g1_i1.p2  ORF type:complete len:142 (-),score=0.36 TRINITY_DN22448_c0_g1_i1:119-544(-)
MLEISPSAVQDRMGSTFPELSSAIPVVEVACGITDKSQISVCLSSPPVQMWKLELGAQAKELTGSECPTSSATAIIGKRISSMIIMFLSITIVAKQLGSCLFHPILRKGELSGFSYMIVLCSKFLRSKCLTLPSAPALAKV